MLMDQPVVDYSGKKKGSMMANRSEVAELDELVSAWDKVRGGRTFVGKEVNLEDFINEKI